MEEKETLRETIALLRETLVRYRRTNALLRKVNSKLQKGIRIAHANDEAFREACEYCEQEQVDGGLPETGSSQTAGAQQGRDVSGDQD
jgi:anti-sigma regulatory factor (Ser/Thr protein kinase)